METGGILACIIAGAVAAVLIVLTCLHFLAPANYPEAVTKFSYSTDGGVSYREGIQELNINQKYYLAVEMQVIASKDEAKQDISVNIVIPNSDKVSYVLSDYAGPKVEGVVDADRNAVVYQFKVVPATAPSKFRVIFECMPVASGDYSIQVEYDDNVASSWDKNETITFV